MASRQITAAPAAARLVISNGQSGFFADLLKPSIPAILNGPGSSRLNNRKFVVRASGNVTGGQTNCAANPFIAIGTSLLGLNTTFITQPGSTAVKIDTGTCPWVIEVTGIFDSVLGSLKGFYQIMLNNTYQAPTVLAAATVATSGEPAFQMTCGVAFANTTIGNSATLTEFYLEG